MKFGKKNVLFTQDSHKLNLITTIQILNIIDIYVETHTLK